MKVRTNRKTGQKAALIEGKRHVLIPAEPAPPDNRPGYLTLRTVSEMYAAFVAGPSTPPISVRVHGILDLRQMVAAVRSGEVRSKNRSDLRPARIETMCDEEIAECRISLSDAEALLARYGQLSAEEVARVLATAPPATDQVQQIKTTDDQTTNAKTIAATDHDAELAELFDSVRHAQLEKMFPDKKWKEYAERAARNGLKAARTGRGLFNPYRAAQWWLSEGPAEWDWERCLRKLANNLPDRSRDSKHMLTGDFDN